MTIAQEHNFGSPDSSAAHLDSFLLDDDLKDSFDADEALERPRKKGSGRGTADKRATHNAIERARRESLNGRFMTLAEALPSMANVKRPSKSIIVNKALEFVFDAQVKEHALIKENNDLRRTVDQLRARLGMGPLPPPAPLPSASTAPNFSHHNFGKSFVGVSLDDVNEEMNASMGAATEPALSVSPEQHSSPTSSFGHPVESPSLAYPTLFGQSPVSSAVGSPNSAGSVQSPQAETPNAAAARMAAANGIVGVSSAPSPNSFLAHANPNMAAQQQAAAAQNQLLFQAQFGLSPGLLQQQHALLLAAAHGQQMQAAQLHQMQGHPSLQDVYGGMSTFAPGPAQQQQQSMGGWGLGVAGGINSFEFAQMMQ